MSVSLYKGLRYLQTMVFLLAMAGVGILGYLAWPRGGYPTLGASEPDAVWYDWPEPVFFTSDEWEVVRRTVAAPASATGPLGQRFRLAGTFFAFPGESVTGDDARSRFAIIDDIEARNQVLVKEGDAIDVAEVTQIFRDRVVLRHAGGEEELWLSFTGGDASAPDAGAGRPGRPSGQPLRFEDMPALETSRFGKRIGENRWVFQRDAIMDYADELQDDPERLLNLFMAMEPYLDDAEQIAGFQLGLRGENDLYLAAGFQEGDVVRQVNSLPMTDPSRAQFFISEFLNGRMTALVLDIERDGQEEKLIYLIR